MLCRRGRTLTASRSRAALGTKQAQECRRLLSVPWPNGAVPPASPLGRSRQRPSASERRRPSAQKFGAPLALSVASDRPCAGLNRGPTGSTPCAPRLQLLSSSFSTSPGRRQYQLTVARPGLAAYHHLPLLAPEDVRFRWGRSCSRAYSSQAIPSSAAQTLPQPHPASSQQPPHPSRQETMVASKIDGTAIAKAIRERIRLEILEKQQTNPRYKPCLKIIQGAW